MGIQIVQNPGQKCLELGGGDRPQLRPNWDARPGPNVDLVVDFEKPLPSPDNEWDGIFSHFALEHISWPNVLKFLAEVFRILKPGAKAAFAVPNTEAQLKWIQEHPEGWDGKPPFESCSEVLFGSQDYGENSHKSFWSPAVAGNLFSRVGFTSVVTRPYGERATDLFIEAQKPGESPEPAKPEIRPAEVAKVPSSDIASKMANSAAFRKEVFGKEYFNGGRKFGGYASDKWGAFRDFPVHHITARHILARKPSSVLEVGCGRGYILKRIQDTGILAYGLEISKHCNMTRCCEHVYEVDICAPEPWFEVAFDLSYSVATLEHIPLAHLPTVIKEMARVSTRGLHGVDFGHQDDGFDRSHCSLFPKERWVELFAEHAPGWPVEIVDKEELERGSAIPEILQGDGKAKLNIGSGITMFHYGWENLDKEDFKEYAEQNGYRFQQMDVTTGIPCGTGVVDLIFTQNFLQKLTYKDGLKFLCECRRIIKPTGAIRIGVPDVGHLLDHDWAVDLVRFAECHDGVANAPTDLVRLFELGFNGQQSVYDHDTLLKMLTEAGFVAKISAFRGGSYPQFTKETIETMPDLNLYVEGIPLVGQ